MAPPSKTPRLARLDPAKFASTTLSEVKARAASLGLRIASPAALRDDLETLVRYAQGTLPLTPTEAREVARRVAGPVYLGSEEELSEPDALRDDWRGRVDIVFRAVACRNRIADGLRIIPGDLAAASSMSAAGVRKAMKVGALSSEHGVIEAAEAQRWLEGRCGHA